MEHPVLSRAESRADRWVTGVTLAAMLALASALLALGVSFYSPRAQAQPDPTEDARTK